MAVIDIVVPDKYYDMEDATVAFWFSKEGDSIDAGDDLVEIETDNASVRIEAPVSGVLVEILAEEGASVRAGDSIGRIDRH